MRKDYCDQKLRGKLSSKIETTLPCLLKNMENARCITADWGIGLSKANGKCNETWISSM